jgi:hypothetical protein
MVVRQFLPRKSLAASYGRARYMRKRVHRPFGLGAVKGQTVRCQRTVLVMMFTGADAVRAGRLPGTAAA